MIPLLMNNIIKLRTRYELMLETEKAERQKKLCLLTVALAAILAGVCLMFVGCTTAKPNGGLPSPQFISDTVRDGVQLGLAIWPDAKDDVGKATGVVCGLAETTTNLASINPQLVVSALEKANITNRNAIIIVNGSIIVWNRAWSYFDPSVITNQTEVHDYANAFCQGMRSGTGQTASKNLKAQQLPPHLNVK